MYIYFMKRNKLFLLLASLSPKEMRQFRKLVVREGTPPMIKLLDFLDHNIKAYDPHSYNELRERALKKISKSVPTDQNKRRLLSAVNQLLDTFLIQQELSENEQTTQALLQNQYLKRRLYNLYASSHESAQTRHLQQPIRDFNFEQGQLKYSHNAYYNITNKYKEKDILNGLKAIHKHLDLGFVMAKLHYACEVKMVQLVRGESFPIELLDKILASIKDNAYFSNPIIQFYQDILNLIEQPTLESYQLLKQKWLELMPLFNKDLQHHLFIIMLNLAWFSSNEHRTEEMFQLYEFGLTTGLLTIHRKIGTSHFNNIVDLGSSLGKFSEIRSFVIKYSPHLDVSEDKTENIKTLYEAFILFGEGKHEESLKQSIFLEFNDVSYGLRAYLLMLKCLYESKKSKGFKEIEMRAEAFKQYLQRKFKQGMLNKQTKQENLNFIKLIRLLPLASASRFANINQQDLLKKLQGMPQVVSRNWLLKKIEQLSK